MITPILELALAKLRECADKTMFAEVTHEEAAALLARLSELEEQLSDGNCPVKYYKHGGVTYAVYGTSSINHAEMLLAKLEAARGMVDGCHCATCTCNPGMTPAIRLDTSPAAQEGAVRDHLIALGWTPPGAQHPAITHCDNCGCDWLDNGLNPVGCPYCKQSEQAAEIEALREEVERLREALALLPDEIVMIEHNPDDGPLMFCCGRKVTLSWRHDLIPTHDEGCWYARMRAMRDHDKEDRND